MRDCHLVQPLGLQITQDTDDADKYKSCFVVAWPSDENVGWQPVAPTRHNEATSTTTRQPTMYHKETKVPQGNYPLCSLASSTHAPDKTAAAFSWCTVFSLIHYCGCNFLNIYHTLAVRRYVTRTYQVPWPMDVRRGEGLYQVVRLFGDIGGQYVKTSVQ